jgi:aspartate racemase
MKIGMVGGIGPESTVDYYRRIIRLYRETTGSDHYPEIEVNSINMTAMLKLVAEQDWDALTAMLLRAVDSLCRAGAGFAFIASNTPHIVFERVRQASPIPLVSIVEAARREAERRALKKTGLLGTLFTMQSGYYQAEFDKSGIAIVVPDEPERLYIQRKLFSEIEQGIFLDSTREGLLRIVRRLIDDHAIDGVVLGCTELPLILTRDEFGIPFLNTTEIHVRRILERYAAL